MLNKVKQFLRANQMLQPGDQLVCAVSGGADSVALLYAMFLLKDSLQIQLSAAHFNHHLRGEESDRDARFVSDLCDRLGIPLHMGDGAVHRGKKGLEAAAREARYRFLMRLPGKIATAHTADDNAETVLLHLIRGTGLKGLGGIAPVSDRLIRPMLTVTRRDVEDFLREYHLQYVEDSTNSADTFLRNRVRHEVMPILRRENPRISENLSALAIGLRLDEAYLDSCAQSVTPDIPTLQAAHPSVRRRYLRRFLMQNGVPEPEQKHIDLLDSLVFSANPSARGNFPGGVTAAREYDRLVIRNTTGGLPERILTCPGKTDIPEAGLSVLCTPATEPVNRRDAFTVVPQGTLVVRGRRTGDVLRTHGGGKLLRKRMIDAKIPASQRDRIPVICDAGGIVGVYGFGADAARVASDFSAVSIRFVPLDFQGNTMPDHDKNPDIP